MTLPRDRFNPLRLTLGIILADQITKAIIVSNLALVYDGGPIIEVIGDFLRIIHARNLGIAFSIGRGLPPVLRTLLFIALPVVVLGGVFWYYLQSDEFTPLQRWALAGILGGGVGNLIDRVFRSGGVVDFIDVRIYGFLGMERWPTFNIADASVVVSGILLLLTSFDSQEKTNE
ncbi:MAG: signal peptidase II [Spirochaetota bacterium]